MVKKKSFTGLFLVSMIFAIVFSSYANAEIIISQPNSLYSLGDTLNIEVSLDSIKTGYMDIMLVCSNLEKSLYYNVPDSTTSISRKLTPDYIGNLSGQCYTQVSYAEEIIKGQIFEISNSIEVDVSTPRINTEVGNTIKVKGNAYKKNNQLVGQEYTAFVKATLINENISSSEKVKDGQFETSIFIPETMHAGVKILKIEVYDLDSSGNILNSGESSAEIAIKQKLARVEVAIDKLEVSPQEEIKIIPFLYDTAGDYIEDNVLIKIIDANQNKLYEGFLTANADFVFKTERNTYPGLIEINAEKDQMTAEKSFELREVKNINIEFNNDTMTITNVGNVPYNDNVEINIGDQKIIKAINLNVDESVKYYLSAPEGTYEIVAKDNSASFSQAGVALTGGSINVREMREKADYMLSRYPIVWIFLFVVLASALYLGYKRHERNKKFGNLPPVRNKYPEQKKQGGIEVIKPDQINKKLDKILLQDEIRKAQQVLVLNGHKQPASIIAIKLKKEIEGIAKDSFTKSLEFAFKAKAVSYNSGENLLLIFSPLITKTFKNEETAIKVATQIDNYLKDHNRKFKNDHISYGIGVNSGDIINQVEGKILQFTNIGKTINGARKIADIANEEVLLSKEIHEKTPGVKTEKITSGAIEAFSVKRIVNSEESAKFINEFLRRNTTK